MNESIGTTGKLIHRHVPGWASDFIIQNLSANDVYFIESESQGIANGVKILPAASMSKDEWLKDIVLIASGATSDVRISMQTYRTLKRVS